MDRLARLAKLRAQMAAEDLPALLVTLPANLLYLVGFSGSLGRLLVTPDSLSFATDGRYGLQAEQELAAAGLSAHVELSAVPGHELLARVASICQGCERVGVEAATLSWAEAQALDERLSVEVVPTRRAVEKLRAVKDADEVAALRRAVELADRALADVLGDAGPECTEAELALAIEVNMRSAGASGVAFETLVAAGERAAMPHHRAGSERLGAQRPVIIDFGCLLDSYCSDCTRTVSWGEPHEDVERLYMIVGRAQDAARNAIRAGVTAKEVDAEAREVIADAGWGEHFTHGTGHGVGLEVHEEPRIAPSADDVLEAGMVVTVEPGVYVPGLGGVRLEDMVVVTADGAETLTGAPRRLVL